MCKIQLKLLCMAGRDLLPASHRDVGRGHGSWYKRLPQWLAVLRMERDKNKSSSGSLSNLYSAPGIYLCATGWREN